jgi:NDP-sugar pyrophosphorylase family protein
MHTPLFVILAGGEGKRFAPFITNKTIFPFCHKPLIQHQLEQLARVGVERVLVATGADNQALIAALHIPGLTIQTKQQATPRGMADALLQLAPIIGNQPIVVMNAVDLVADELYVQLLNKIAQQQPYGIITGMTAPAGFVGGYLQLETSAGGQEVVRAIVEKPAAGAEPSDVVNLVYHYFSQPTEFFDRLAAGQNQSGEADDVYEQALSTLLTDHDFAALRYHDYWQKLKYPHYVLDVMQLFLEKRLTSYRAPSAQISPQAVIEGTVYIDEDVQIEAGAIIKGPVYLGPRTVVSNHCLVRQAMIEADVVTGFGSEIARSYVGPGCALHHNFIGDSVLEARINPSYGTVTTNFRLDKQTVTLKLPDQNVPTTRTKLGALIAADVFCGVQTIFLPGVTVGAGAHIYPQTVVHRAVPAGAVYKSRQTQTMELAGQPL